MTQLLQKYFALIKRRQSVFAFSNQRLLLVWGTTVASHGFLLTFGISPRCRQAGWWQLLKIPSIPFLPSCARTHICTPLKGPWGGGSCSHKDWLNPKDFPGTVCVLSPGGSWLGQHHTFPYLTFLLLSGDTNLGLPAYPTALSRSQILIGSFHEDFLT